MDLTNSVAEGWRMRSKKSCQVSGAVAEPNAPELSMVIGSKKLLGTAGGSGGGAAAYFLAPKYREKGGPRGWGGARGVFEPSL